jgi:hypothetical protein
VRRVLPLPYSLLVMFLTKCMRFIW